MALAQEGQSEAAQGHTELPSPSSSDALAPQQRMRRTFVRRQENRLHTLINDGHIFVGNRSLVWVDENGLLTAQNMNRSKYLKESTPFFHAGSGADVNEIFKSHAVSRHSWGREDLGKEKTVLSSLLESLVMKEIKYLPVITHLAWKKLLADLESSTAIHTSAELKSKLQMAIGQEKQDWGHLNHFVHNCEDQDRFLYLTDLYAFSQALYRIAGINADQNKPWTALREIDESLADDIFTLCHLANRMQSCELSLEQLPFLAELARGLSETLGQWEMAYRMARLLTAVN